MRGGTENIAGILGLAKAFELTCDNMAERHKYIGQLRSYFIDQLQSNFEDIQFNGDYDGQCLYTVLSVSFPPSPKSDLAAVEPGHPGRQRFGGKRLHLRCRSRLTCIGSHWRRSFPENDPFSFSHYNTKEEVDWVIEKLKSIVAVKQMVG